jgi:hypothetical protein
MATCRHCGYEAPSFTSCPLCGVPTGESGESETGSTELPPWEDGGRSFPGNFLDTVVRSCFRPAEFFSGVPWEDAAARPLLYYLLVSIIAGLFGLWWTAAFAAIGTPFPPSSDPLFEPLLGMSPAGQALFGFFITPFAAMVTLVLWAGLLHLLTLVLARDRRGFRATVRSVCYGSGPALLTVIPWVGGLVGFLWSLVLTGIGIARAHRTTGGTAAAIVGLGVLLPLGILFVLFVLLFASLAALDPLA